MVSATFNSDGKLTGTGAGLPLPPARQGSLGLLLQLKITGVRVRSGENCGTTFRFIMRMVLYT